MLNRIDLQDSSSLKAVIIGCGGIGFKYDHSREVEGALTHFSAISKSPAFDLMAVCDTDPEVGKIIHEQYGTLVYKDYMDMMSKESPIDMVVVATPDETHVEILQKLIDFSPGLVFAEKPLAMSRKLVQQIVTGYELNEIGLQVNFYRRFTREFQEVKTIVESGGLGRVQAVTVYYSRGFFHNCCHFIDLICWYFGLPERAVLESERPGLTVDDPTRNLILYYPEGLEIRLVGLETSRLLTYEVDILGTSGRIRLLHGGVMEVYSCVQNRTWPDFMQFELTEKKDIDFKGALPRALENIHNWFKNKEQLASPGKNSVNIYDIEKMMMAS